eukprot:4629974-Prymnesium_polylepis.2
MGPSEDGHPSRSTPTSTTTGHSGRRRSCRFASRQQDDRHCGPPVDAAADTSGRVRAEEFKPASPQAQGSRHRQTGAMALLAQRAALARRRHR